MFSGGIGKINDNNIFKNQSEYNNMMVELVEQHIE